MIDNTDHAALGFLLGDSPEAVRLDNVSLRELTALAP